MTQSPLPQPPAPPPPERESDAQFLVGVMSLLLGAMFLLGALILYASGGTGLAGEGLPRFRLVAAIGAGLFALGAALEFPRFMDLVRQRKSLHAANAVLMSLLAFALLIIVNFLSARHDFWRADLTQEGLYTLSEESTSLVAGLDRDVRLVVLTVAEQDRDMAPLDALIDQYRTASSRLRVDRKDLRRMSQSELQVLIKELELEGVRDENELLGVAVQTGVQTAEGFQKQRSKHVPRAELWEQAMTEQGKRTFLGEQKLSSAIREVIADERPKLYFLTGHAEASIDEHGENEGLGKLAAMLRQRNMELERLNLSQGQPVPDDCDLLVVPGPRVTLDPREVQSVARYLEQGGDAIIMLDPVYEPGGGGTRYMPTGLEDLLRERYGVVAQDRLIYRQFQDQFGGIVLTEEVQCDDYDHAQPVVAPLSKSQARVLFIGARPVKSGPVQGATATELVKTGTISPATFSTDDPIGFQEQKRPTGELEQAPFTLMTAGERTVTPDAAADGGPDGGPDAAPGASAASKRSRVVVVGDTDWVENLVVGVYRLHNLELFLNAASWAMEREEQVVGKAARPKSYRLEMTPDTLAAMKLFSIFGLPAVAVGLGLFAWMLRRR